MEIVHKDGFSVVGLRVVAGWDDLWTAMPEAWKTFVARHTEIGNRVGAAFMDVSLGRDNGRYTQLIGAEVSGPGALPEGMVSLEIPRQQYLHHRHVGPLPGIAATFGEMYAWARAHELEADEFKLDIGYTGNGRESGHDLFIRIRPAPGPHGVEPAL